MDSYSDLAKKYQEVVISCIKK